MDDVRLSSVLKFHNFSELYLSMTSQEVTKWPKNSIFEQSNQPTSELIYFRS